MGQRRQQIAAPPPETARTESIERALTEAAEGTHFVPSEEGYLELPVAQLPAEVLVYRADNGRILSELADAADGLGRPLQRLKAEGEGQEVQQLLHGLLIEKAQDPDGPIYHELEKHGRQTEPLLIRRDGLVVNGNRRLAALRELAGQDPGRYGHLLSVRAAVLPAGIDNEKLEYIEAALQMAPDLKLDYSWINRRLKLRQHARDLSRERVMAAYRFADAAEIDTELGELELAEAYLSWIGEPSHFRLIAEAERRFRDLYAQLTVLKPPHLADLWRLIGFAMIRAEPRLDANIGHYFPFTEPMPAAVRQWVLRTLAEDRGLTERQAAGQNLAVDKPLAGRIRPWLGDAAQADTIARAAIGLSDTLKGNQQRLLGTHRVLSSLKAARNALDEMDIQDMNDHDLRQIRAEFAAVQQHIQALEPGDPTRRPLAGRTERKLPGVLRGLLRRLRL